MSEERDVTRARVIKKGFEMHPRQDRANRPVWAWLQRDKLSAAWQQALPSPDTSLSNAEFSGAAAAALCLPSPACSDRLGQVIRGAQVVDLYGESVLCTITTGDHYRKGMILTRCDFSRCANGLEWMLKWKSSTCLLDRSYWRGCVRWRGGERSSRLSRT